MERLLPDSATARRARRTRRKAISRGVGWNAVGLIASKGVNLLGKLVLAAFLVPEHFGAVSMVLVFTKLVRSAADLGLRFTLVQRKRDGGTRLLYDSAFWFLLTVSAVLMLVMWLAGVPLLVWFYGAPELSGIAVGLSFDILLFNLHVVPASILTRIGRFKAITTAELLGALIGTIAAIVLAFAGAGPWSLVAQVIVGSLCTGVILFVATGWTPRLRFSIEPLRNTRQYSSYVFGSRLLFHVQQNLDFLLLGKLMGAQALGIYAIAFLLTETVRAHVYWIVSRVLFPVYSRIISDRKQIAIIYCATVRYMTLVMFPVSMFLILYSYEAIEFLLGDQWLEAARPVQILAAASMLVAMTGTGSDVLKAIGKAEIDFAINMRVTFVVALPALWIGISMFGVPGAAWAVLIFCAAARAMFFVALRREIGVKSMDVLGAAGPAIAGSVLMFLCSHALAGVNWVAAATAALGAYLIPALPVVLRYFATERELGAQPGTTQSRARSGAY